MSYINGNGLELTAHYDYMYFIIKNELCELYTQRL